MSNLSFIKEVAGPAIEVQKKYDILPSLIIAQACLESGYGKSSLATEGNNLFGIKGTFHGAFVEMHTKEWTKQDGWITIKAKFRKYPSWHESIEDHAQLFVHGLSSEKHNRYAAVIGESDYKKASRIIHRAGYATDPDYPKLLNQLIERYNLTWYDKESRQMKQAVSKNTYTVKSGDTLSHIAQQNGTTVKKISEENQLVNPDLIYPGQVLSLPSLSTSKYYTVKNGDTLTEIANKFDTSAPCLATLNKLKNPDRIYPGQKIRVM